MSDFDTPIPGTVHLGVSAFDTLQCGVHSFIVADLPLWQSLLSRYRDKSATMAVNSRPVEENLPIWQSVPAPIQIVSAKQAFYSGTQIATYPTGNNACWSTQ